MTETGSVADTVGGGNGCGMIETLSLRLYKWDDSHRAEFAEMQAYPEVMADLGGPIDRAQSNKVRPLLRRSTRAWRLSLGCNSRLNVSKGLQLFLRFGNQTIVSVTMAAFVCTCGATETRSGGLDIAAPSIAQTLAPAVTRTESNISTTQPNGTGRQSRYTSLRDCRIIRSVPEEAGYARSLCPGLGGYSLQLVEADGRHNLIVVTPGGQEHNLHLPSMSGGGFSSLGDTVEWRGVLDSGALRPDAMIVRYNVVENPSEPTRPTSYLLGVSLAGIPCLAARIAPGDGQNERARAAADGPVSCM